MHQTLSRLREWGHYGPPSMNLSAAMYYAGFWYAYVIDTELYTIKRPRLYDPIPWLCSFDICQVPESQFWCFIFRKLKKSNFWNFGGSWILGGNWKNVILFKHKHYFHAQSELHMFLSFQMTLLSTVTAVSDLFIFKVNVFITVPSDIFTIATLVPWEVAMFSH